MITVSHIDVHGWAAAVRGMRNAMNSWGESDSFDGRYTYDEEAFNNAKAAGLVGASAVWGTKEPASGFPCDYVIGPNDLGLMHRLLDRGSDHSKFMRYIVCSMDILAPIYWWKEMETYRIGTATNPSEIEMNSCSTMHKIHSKPFTIDDFSHEHLDDDAVLLMHDEVEFLNRNRQKFINSKRTNKDAWWQLIQTLPSSYNQLRTMQFSYAALRGIYHARKNHKLDEWRFFCDVIRALPYSELITR